MKQPKLLLDIFLMIVLLIICLSALACVIVAICIFTDVIVADQLIGIILMQTMVILSLIGKELICYLQKKFTARQVQAKQNIDK